MVRGEPCATPTAGPTSADLEEAGRRLARHREAGTRAREAVSQVADSLGIPRNAVYRLWLERGRRDGE